MSQPAQPIHPDILPKLDPEYVEFHNAHIANIVPPHTIPWDPSIRATPHVPGASEPLEVGNIKDISLSHCQVRVFTPKGSRPVEGWPVFIYLHGGGWVLGGIHSNNPFSTNVCMRASCVVVSVDYRLAPENPYPAAVEDAIEVLEWVYYKGNVELGINPNQIAVGGSSAGGNLAAVMSLKAALYNPPIPLVLQLLIVPVTDNTATISGDPYPSWRELQHTPWLSSGRMLWFRDHYLPNEEDRTKWDNSPIFAPEELLAKTPKAWVGVAELDILRDEGIAYGEKLRKAGVDVEIEVYKAVPHQTMSMDGVLTVGKQFVSDCVRVVGRAFNTL